jgi:hypothetical protein
MRYTPTGCTARIWQAGNDAYANAASQKLDKVLNSQVKSICRGC